MSVTSLFIIYIKLFPDRSYLFFLLLHQTFRNTWSSYSVYGYVYKTSVLHIYLIPIVWCTRKQKSRNPFPTKDTPQWAADRQTGRTFSPPLLSLNRAGWSSGLGLSACPPTIHWLILLAAAKASNYWFQLRSHIQVERYRQYILESNG